MVNERELKLQSAQPVALTTGIDQKQMQLICPLEDMENHLYLLPHASKMLHWKCFSE